MTSSWRCLFVNGRYTRIVCVLSYVTYIYVTHTSCNNFVYCICLHVQRTDMQMNVFTVCRVWGQDEHNLWLLHQFTANLLEIGVTANTYWDTTVQRNGLWIRRLCSLLFSVALVHNVGLSDCRGKKGTTFRILKEYEKDSFWTADGVYRSFTLNVIF